jgi:sulfur-oxidizing protein SoxZ
MARVLINLPSHAKPGEIIEIKTLIAHPMETGYRLDSTGAAISRDIINHFVCSYNGDEIFRAELFPAIAANPFIAFFTTATESGELVFSWTDDHGQTQTEVRQITVK